MADEQGTGVSTTNEPVEVQSHEAGASVDQGTTQEPKNEAPKSDSANVLIKRFAQERGVTVEELIDQFKSYEDASKTEREKIEADLNRYKTEAESATKELREWRARAALQDAVSALPNVYDPSTVVDLAMSLVEYDEAGKPANIEDAIATLKERRPKLFPAAAGSGDGGKGGAGGTTDTDLNTLLRQMAKA